MRLRIGLVFCGLVTASTLGVVYAKQLDQRPQSAAPVAPANSDQPSTNRPPSSPGGAESKRLPPGILAFNTESNQTKVVQGEPQAHFTFDFTNVSPREITIVAIDTSCACTTTDPPPLPWKVGPHETGRIPVAMDVEHDTGRMSETVTLTTLQGLKDLTVVTVISPAPTNANQASPPK
jgi:hypothetical protein